MGLLNMRLSIEMALAGPCPLSGNLQSGSSDLGSRLQPRVTTIRRLVQKVNQTLTRAHLFQKAEGTRFGD